jgi:putative transposase
MATTFRTICCKLAPTPEQAASIDATLVAFASACTMAAECSSWLGTPNSRLVQKSCYGSIRLHTGLTANLAIRAIARACGVMTLPERLNSTFDPTSADYDARVMKYHERDDAFGLTLLTGRTAIKAVLGDYQREALAGYSPKSATLVKRHDGGYYLHVQVVRKAPEPAEVIDVIGVDLGVVNLAVDSGGETFTGARVEAARRCYGRRRQVLNQVGTKSARRRLRKIRKKESRFRRDTNHVISKRLIHKAQCTKCAIALEDLQGVSARTKARKPDRSRMKGWAYHQLRTFFTYKALAAGIPLVFVNPAYTSQMCSQCGH